mmetsp:Transcript_50048/g.140330  ORF Transcript_50048/g.140330 Transcript_50048/m.140330 type:complete len:255 (+) Transcript_50048:350-1114(+)
MVQQSYQRLQAILLPETILVLIAILAQRAHSPSSHLQHRLVVVWVQKPHKGGDTSGLADMDLIDLAMLCDEPHRVATLSKEFLSVVPSPLLDALLLAALLRRPSCDHLNQTVQSLGVGDRGLVVLVAIGDVAQGVGRVLKDKNVGFGGKEADERRDDAQIGGVLNVLLLLSEQGKSTNGVEPYKRRVFTHQEVYKRFQPAELPHSVLHGFFMCEVPNHASGFLHNGRMLRIQQPDEQANGASLGDRESVVLRLC